MYIFHDFPTMRGLKKRIKIIYSPRYDKYVDELTPDMFALLVGVIL